MSGGTLPKTGIGALTVGGVAGYGATRVPIPIVIATTAILLVVAGAVLVRVGWRRRRPAGSR